MTRRREASYVARQLYDLQIGVRNGAWSDLMDAAVADEGLGAVE